MAAALPTESARVELSKTDLLAMLEEAGAVESAAGSDQEPLMDLSVSEIMEATGKARSTVIGWINNGDLESYMFGREHRITRVEWRAFLSRRRRGEELKKSSSAPNRADAPKSKGTGDELGSWRGLVAGGSR